MHNTSLVEEGPQPAGGGSGAQGKQCGEEPRCKSAKPTATENLLRALSDSSPHCCPVRAATATPTALQTAVPPLYSKLFYTV